MPAVAGISGGRTSAMMAYLLDLDVVLSFQNTGREAAGTYDFIARLEQDLRRPITRLEYRAPARGEPPIKSTFEIVRHGELSRRGEPFIDLLECMRTYRKQHKNAGPVAPWARSRVCTAYLKIRTQRKFCASLGWGTQKDYTEYVGLRADEPLRLARMRKRNDDFDTDERAPLADANVTKADVLAFWSDRPFDLTVPEYLGNCTACFLKDEADLATAMMHDETDAPWWNAIEENYAPMRRGRPSYAQVFAEAPDRMLIREALRTNAALIPTTNLSPRRRKLIIDQELAPRTPFSCECDAAKADDFDDSLEAA